MKSQYLASGSGTVKHSKMFHEQAKMFHLTGSVKHSAQLVFEHGRNRGNALPILCPKAAPCAGYVLHLFVNT